MLLRLAVVALFLLFASSAVPAADNLDRSATNLVFVESSDTRGVDKHKITSCVSLLVREMNLAGKDLPRVLVLHVSEKAGKALNVRTSIRRNWSRDHGDIYYEFWIVGQGRAADYAVSLQALLQEHFQLRMTDAERKEMLRRVVRILNATVSAYGE